MKRYLHQLKLSLTGQDRLSDRHADEVCGRCRSPDDLYFGPFGQTGHIETPSCLWGREEAEFYEPRQASLIVRLFVVMGLRNSLIGDHLNHHSAVNSDDIMYQFTMDAITYFARQDLAALAELALESYGSCQGIFAGMDTNYPAAWTALTYLGQIDPSQKT